MFFSVEWLVFDESDKLFEDGSKGFKSQVTTNNGNGCGTEMGVAQLLTLFR